MTVSAVFEYIYIFKINLIVFIVVVQLIYCSLFNDCCIVAAKLDFLSVYIMLFIETENVHASVKLLASV